MARAGTEDMLRAKPSLLSARAGTRRSNVHIESYSVSNSTGSRPTKTDARGRQRNQKESIEGAVDSFRRILRELRLVARKTELATGLSAAQLFVLASVIATPGCSVNDIAEATMTDRTSAAAIVDRLADEGYVTRRRAGDDKRRASIDPTSRGRRAAQESPPAPTALLIAGLENLTTAELKGLVIGLVALTRGMGIEDAPAEMLFEEKRSSRRRKRPPTVRRTR